MGGHDEKIDLNAAVQEVRKACIHFADLYFHFTRVLVEEFGEEEAERLIKKAIGNRATERGLSLRKEAGKRGLPLTLDTWSKVTDIPFLGWDKSLGRLHCPYAEGWLGRYADNPWFARFAALYCDINDTLVMETFTGNLSQKITKNVLWGDDTCEREFFPLPDAGNENGG